MFENLIKVYEENIIIEKKFDNQSYQNYLNDFGSYKL